MWTNTIPIVHSDKTDGDELIMRAQPDALRLHTYSDEQKWLSIIILQWKMKR